MKKRTIFLAALCLCLVLSGCGKKGLEQEPDQWRLEDFEGCMTEDFDSLREAYLLAEGTEEENTVVVLQGKDAGPIIYIVAGVHGDEQAGWLAGNLLKNATIQSGTVYIVSPANYYGAHKDQRRTKEGWDLNRSFPGDPAGGDAQRIAHAIFTDIQDKQPALVLDLHEAQPKEDDYEKLGSNYDALGNSLICHSLDGIGELVLDAMLTSEAGELCSSPLTLYGSPPSGSVNQTVAQQLDIPAITVETLRSEPLAQRVRNQLDLVEFILEYYDMR